MDFGNFKECRTFYAHSVDRTTVYSYKCSNNRKLIIQKGRGSGARKDEQGAALLHTLGEECEDEERVGELSEKFIWFARDPDGENR